MAMIKSKTLLISLGLLAGAQVNAATFNFYTTQANEQGYSTFYANDDGVYLDATASASGSNGVFVYMDGGAAMGVCSVGLTISNQCVQGGDDNVTNSTYHTDGAPNFDEILTWSFYDDANTNPLRDSVGIGDLSINFLAEGHGNLNQKAVEYSLGAGSTTWMGLVTDTNGLSMLSMLGNSVINFRVAEQSYLGKNPDQFYILGTTVSAVPLPAAGWLFGSVLGMFGAWRNRRKLTRA